MPQSTLAQLQATINERKTASPETSYTAQLLHQGQDKILKKVIEEAGEVLMASKDGKDQCTKSPTSGFTASSCSPTTTSASTMCSPNSPAAKACRD